jgi:queuine/archaeosine tRNA-ribosyltransferase
MLGPILLSIHNLTYYQRLMAEVREAIAADRFNAFRDEKLRGWTTPTWSQGSHPEGDGRERLGEAQTRGG